MKKLSKADFLREWGLPYPSFRYHHLRYLNPPERGVYWFYFSLWVRQRDVERWGTCISCGREITVDTCDAGHFMPAKDCGETLLFHPLNVNAECSQCNAWDQTHLLGYARGLDLRYGEGTAEQLEKQYRDRLTAGIVEKPLKAAQYAEKIRELSTYPLSYQQE